MDDVPDEVAVALAKDTRAAFLALFDDDLAPGLFLVDHRAHDEEIIRDCEQVLQTGQLRFEADAERLAIVYGDRRHDVPLTLSPQDRHITLVALNDAMRPDYEVRMLIDSDGSDTLVFAALSSRAWRTLDQRYPAAVPRRFYRLAPRPNVFTDVLTFDAALQAITAKSWWHRLIGRT